MVQKKRIGDRVAEGAEKEQDTAQKEQLNEQGQGSPINSTPFYYFCIFYLALGDILYVYQKFWLISNSFRVVCFVYKLNYLQVFKSCLLKLEADNVAEVIVTSIAVYLQTTRKSKHNTEKIYIYDFLFLYHFVCIH